MWTRSAQKTDGTYDVTVWKDGEVFAEETFTCPEEARIFGETKQRQALMLTEIDAQFGWTDEDEEMTLDEIMAELEL